MEITNRNREVLPELGDRGGQRKAGDESPGGCGGGGGAISGHWPAGSSRVGIPCVLAVGGTVETLRRPHLEERQSERGTGRYGKT